MKRKMVYLAGGINGLTDDEAKAWRDRVKRELASLFIFVDPMDRDFRGQEAGNHHEIVQNDLDEMLACQIIFARVERPSWGTGMEIFHAKWHSRLVIAYGAPERPSPWLVEHTHLLCNTLEDGIEALRARAT